MPDNWSLPTVISLSAAAAAAFSANHPLILPDGDDGRQQRQPISPPYSPVAAAAAAAAAARLTKRQAGALPGPPPSTGVALIILYSVTGIITALFLLIIVTGAVRAHRHPERYGPRAIARLGHPRQSRAKGLARAVLDTIPIVRFGATAAAAGDVPERSPAADEDAEKNSDVEMQEHASSVHLEPPASAGPPGATDAAGATPRDGAIRDGAGDDSATATATASPATTPAPATTTPPPATTTPPPTTTPTPADAPPIEARTSQNQCPVCMDDFEQGQEVRVLPCRHNFHPDCIDPWLLNVSGSCPLCRIDLHPEGERADDDDDDDDEDSDGAERGDRGGDRQQQQQRDQGGEAHRQHQRSGSRLSRYLIVARGTSSREERMAALRQLRQEGRAGGPAGAHRSRMHDFGVSRFARAISRRG